MSDKKRTQAELEISVVDQALRNGHPPQSSDKNIKSAPQIAADKLGADRRRFMPRVGTPDIPGKWEIKYGLKPNWDSYVPKKEEPSADPVELRRLRDKVQSLQTSLIAAERRAAAAEDVRKGVAGLFSDPPPPRPIVIPPRNHSKAGEIPLINLFDLQYGEVVDLQKMDGINSYNAATAEVRLGRFFGTVTDLLTSHWNGPRPPKAYFALGGDLVSGEIHDELVKTNDRSSIESVRDLTSLLKGGLEQLQRDIDCPIEVISIPGNHGRITKKKESKRYVLDSYDTLVGWSLETHFNRPGSPINVTVPPSGDAMTSIYGRNILWTHGDRIGTRGGDGGAGVAAPTSRGMRKIIAEYAARGIRVDTIIMGHWHTALELEDGFVSGSLVGWSEYARDCRFKPLPASQWLLTVHPIWGIAQRWKVFVGGPSEGSIYQTPGIVE